MHAKTPWAVEEYKEFQVEAGGQDILVTWFPAHDVPEGKRHGSAGICVTDNNEIVLITPDGKNWGFPGGRPEDDESWEETLRREVREEACVEVRNARLLGFGRTKCIRGHEKGLVLVRSIWLAKVQLNGWEPEPGMLARKPVSPEKILEELESDVFLPMYHRALIVAGLLKA
jgi:ADP-ribose pyrophosphatase YjhB (NUDIX family)